MTSTATFHAGPGEVVTCTFTNSGSAYISVGVVTQPAGDPQPFDFDLRVAGGSVVRTVEDVRGTDSAPTAFDPVRPGTYVVSLTNFPVGWNFSSNSCDNTDTPTVETVSAAELVVGAGEHWECIFINTKLASVSVRKVTNPLSGTPFGFSLVIPGTPGVVLETQLGVRATDAAPRVFDSVLAPGLTYGVVEGAPGAGRHQDSASCDNTGTVVDEAVSAASFVPGAGEHWLCTFTNSRRASVTVAKTTVGGDGAFTFGLTGQGNQVVTTVGGTAQGSWSDVVAGDYTLQETSTTEFDLDPAMTCTANLLPLATTPHITSGIVDGVNFHVNAGDDVSCAFRNVKRGHLIVRKAVDKNPDPLGLSGNPDFHFSGPAGATGNLKGGGQFDVLVRPNADTPIAAGPYTESEDTIPAGWRTRRHQLRRPDRRYHQERRSPPRRLRDRSR